MHRLIFIVFLMSTLFSQVNIEKSRKDGNQQTFDLKFQFYSGNSKFSSVHAKYRLDRAFKRNHIMLIASMDRGSKSEEIFLKKGFLHGRLTHNLNTRIGVEYFNQIEFNKFRQLHQRLLNGLGLRIPIIIKNIGLNSNLGIAIMLEIEEYTDVAEEFRSWRNSNYFSASLKLDKLEISSITYFQPDVEKLNDYRVLSDFSLKFNLYKNINFVSTIAYSYDSKPVNSDVEKYDFSLQNGINLEF